jgi:hypothetical protein
VGDVVDVFRGAAEMNEFTGAHHFLVVGLLFGQKQQQVLEHYLCNLGGIDDCSLSGFDDSVRWSVWILGHSK